MQGKIQWQNEKLILPNQLYTVKAEQINKLYYKPIGAIVCTDHQGKESMGTACLLSSLLVLTAAHNVYDNKGQNRGQRKNIRFYPNAYGPISHGVQILKIQVSQSYKAGSTQVADDYAFCKLEQRVQQGYQLRIGYNFLFHNDKDTNLSSLSIFGYPKTSWTSDKKRDKSTIEPYPYSVQLKGLCLRQNFSDRIKSTSLEMAEIRHFISTDHGHSGSPIIAKINGEFMIIGIHKGTTSGTSNTQYNIGILFNSEFIKRLLLFVKSENIEYLNMENIKNISPFVWDPLSKGFSSYHIQNTRITRVGSKKGPQTQIKSLNLDTLFTVDGLLKLWFTNFNYTTNASILKFGVIVGSGQQEQQIVYRTAKETNRCLGMVSKVISKQGYKHTQQQFVRQEERVQMIVSIERGSVVFLKGQKSWSIPLDIKDKTKIRIFAFVEIRFEGDSLEVSKYQP